MPPKRWGQTRDMTLQHSECVVDGMRGTLKQREHSKGVWTVVCEDKVVAYFIIYVDGVLIRAPTKWLLAVVEVFKRNWETCEKLQLTFE